MNRRSDKQLTPSMCTAALASAALVLCLFTGQAFRVARSAADFLSLISENRIEKSSPVQSALTSLESQARLQTKAPRRQAPLGELQPSSAFVLPEARGQHRIAEALLNPSTPLTLPNDRAPPAQSL